MKKSIICLFLALFLIACEKASKDLQLSPSSVNLYYEEVQQLKVLNENGPFEWSTANDFHAIVNLSGKITAGHVGSTVVTVKQGEKKGTCSVTIKPKYYLYDTPYLGWGETMSQVSSKLGTPTQTQAKALIYTLSESDGIIAMYLFTDGKLTGVGILVNIKNAATLAHYLVERYQPFSVEDGKYYFMNALNFSDATLGLVMSYVNTSSIQAYQVIYAPANQQRNAPARFAPFADTYGYLEIPENYSYLFK